MRAATPVNKANISKKPSHVYKKKGGSTTPNSVPPPIIPKKKEPVEEEIFPLTVTPSHLEQIIAKL
jgi:hypothetical protein